MDRKEMKEILFKKLQAEGTYFKKSDISVRKDGEDTKIVVKDYEHIPFIVRAEMDDFFGYVVSIFGDDDIITMETSHKDYDFKAAMIELGYYIGTRF